MMRMSHSGAATFKTVTMPKMKVHWGLAIVFNVNFLRLTKNNSGLQLKRSLLIHVKYANVLQDVTSVSRFKTHGISEIFWKNNVCSIFTNHLGLILFTSEYVILWGFWRTFLWLEQFDQKLATKILRHFDIYMALWVILCTIRITLTILATLFGSELFSSSRSKNINYFRFMCCYVK